MRPPAPFFDAPPEQQRARSTLFSSVALSFLAPLFFILVLFADCLDRDAPFERRTGVAFVGKGLRSSSSNQIGDRGAMIPDLITIDALSSVTSAPPAPGGVAVPLTLHGGMRSHRSTWGILRHALRPLVPALLRSAALEEEGDGLVAFRTGGRAYHDDDGAGRSSGRGPVFTTERRST